MKKEQKKETGWGSAAFGAALNDLATRFENWASPSPNDARGTGAGTGPWVGGGGGLLPKGRGLRRGF